MAGSASHCLTHTHKNTHRFTYKVHICNNLFYAFSYVCQTNLSPTSHSFRTPPVSIYPLRHQFPEFPKYTYILLCHSLEMELLPVDGAPLFDLEQAGMDQSSLVRGEFKEFQGWEWKAVKRLHLSFQVQLQVPRLSNFYCTLSMHTIWTNFLKYQDGGTGDVPIYLNFTQWKWYVCIM